MLNKFLWMAIDKLRSADDYLRREIDRLDSDYHQSVNDLCVRSEIAQLQADLSKLRADAARVNDKFMKPADPSDSSHRHSPYSVLPEEEPNP